MWTWCRHSHYWLIEPSVSPVVAQTLISLYWTKGFNLVDIFGSNSAESDSPHSVIQGEVRHCVIQRGVRLSAQCYTRRSPCNTVLYSAESDSPHSVKQGEVRHCVIQRGVWLTAQCYTRRSPTLCYLQHGVVCILIPHCMWYLARGVSVFVREKIICKTILRFRLFIVHSSLSSRSQEQQHCICIRHTVPLAIDPVQRAQRWEFRWYAFPKL